MKKQTNLTSNIDREINEQTIQTYRSPEVYDLGKASKLLQGGSSLGKDNFNQTQW
jgi:hypothetical protein